uniref:Uncharacterized protein n=1 Tax=Cacopsylla melanoneura TaxID=428564 RepID=A0A8D8T9R3_9HEMI
MTQRVGLGTMVGVVIVFMEVLVLETALVDCTFVRLTSANVFFIFVGCVTWLLFFLLYCLFIESWTRLFLGSSDSNTLMFSIISFITLSSSSDLNLSLFNSSSSSSVLCFSLSNSSLSCNVLSCNLSICICLLIISCVRQCIWYFRSFVISRIRGVSLNVEELAVTSMAGVPMDRIVSLLGSNTSASKVEEAITVSVLTLGSCCSVPGTKFSSKEFERDTLGELW